MSIKVKKCTVSITQGELDAIVKAVREGIDETEFTDEPMPEGDMSVAQYVAENRRRGVLRIEPYVDGVAFEVDVRGNCESAGYRLV